MESKVSLDQDGGDSQPHQKQRKKDVPCPVAGNPKFIPKRPRYNEQDYRAPTNRPPALRLPAAQFRPPQPLLENN
jgi:hypothetical protein